MRAEAREAAEAHAQCVDAARAANAALQQQTHEYDELARQCAWWEQVEDEARVQREEIEDTIAAREREAPLAVAAKERLTREIGEREQTASVLQQEVETQRAAIGSMQTQLAVQQQRKEHLSRAIAQLRTERQGLLDERSKIAATRSEREEALRALQKELSATEEATRQDCLPGAGSRCRTQEAACRPGAIARAARRARSDSNRFGKSTGCARTGLHPG